MNLYYKVEAAFDGMADALKAAMNVADNSEETELDLSGSVAIERKMDLNELCGCFCRSRDRFEREFICAKNPMKSSICSLKTAHGKRRMRAIPAPPVWLDKL